jgi:hypothetical protein
MSNLDARQIVALSVHTLSLNTGFPIDEERYAYIEVLLMKERDPLSEERYLKFLSAYQECVTKDKEKIKEMTGRVDRIADNAIQLLDKFRVDMNIKFDEAFSKHETRGCSETK